MHWTANCCAVPLCPHLSGQPARLLWDGRFPQRASPALSPPPAAWVRPLAPECHCWSPHLCASFETEKRCRKEKKKNDSRVRFQMTLNLSAAFTVWNSRHNTCMLRKWFSLVNEWLREGVFSWLPPRMLRPFFFSLRAPCWWRRILSSCSSTLILCRLLSAAHSCCSTALRGRSCSPENTTTAMQKTPQRDTETEYTQ